MKKILLVIMVLMMSVIGMGAKKSKITDKTYEGEYTKATNEFIYIKDNLVFPNKVLVYSLQDNTGLIETIYNFMGQNYGVTDTDSVVFKVTGTVSKDGVLTVKKINNYTIPEYRLHPLGYDFITPAAPASTDDSNTEEENPGLINDSPSNLNNPGSFFNQNDGN